MQRILICCALMSGAVVTAARAESSSAILGLSSGAIAWDNFDRSNRLLNGDHAPSGQTWCLTGAGASTAAISNGMYVVTANTYAYLPANAAIGRIAGAFSYASAAGDLSENLTLIADAGGRLETMLHLNFGPTGWGLTKRISGGPFLCVAQGQYNLQCDGTVYGIAMEMGAGTVTVILPDGRRVTATDPDIGSTIVPNYGAWQIAPYVGSRTGRWHGITMGPSIGGTVTALLGAASQAGVAFFEGAGITNRQRISTTLNGGPGWYRISTASVFLTYAMAGQVSLTALDSRRGTVWQLNAKGFCQRFPNVPLAETFGTTFGGGAITQVRLSRESSSGSVALDVYVPNSEPVSLVAEFFGYFTPLPTPLGGATPLADECSVLPVTQGI